MGAPARSIALVSHLGTWRGLVGPKSAISATQDADSPTVSALSLAEHRPDGPTQRTTTSHITLPQDAPRRCTSCCCRPRRDYLILGHAKLSRATSVISPHGLAAAKHTKTPTSKAPARNYLSIRAVRERHLANLCAVIGQSLPGTKKTQDP